MLRELHISNLAVIADAAVEFDAGLNCFTGQTGAGKSLVLGALELLLALRSGQNMLRAGAAEARITGVFIIQNPIMRRRLADVTDLPLTDEPEMILVRRIHESGRTTASLNGHPLTGAMLKSIAETLVDIHGQHDAQYLLKPGNQLALLDDAGHLGQIASAFRELYQQRKELISQSRELAASQTLRRQQMELYDFQLREIEDAAPQPGELEVLEARHRLLSNIEKIKRLAGSAYEALYEDDAAIIGRLKTVTTVLLEAAELNPEFIAAAGQVKDSTIALDDAAFTLRRTLDRLELDPEELANITDRLNTLNRLISKYCGHGGGMDQLLHYQKDIKAQWSELKSVDQNSAQCDAEIRALEQKLASLGAQLSSGRRKAAEVVIPGVHAQLADLGMKDAQFHIEFQAVQTPPGTDNGTDVDPYVSPQGLESVEFMLAPNPGQPARPLRKIASGGELSRVMLAVKSILAASDRVSVLVFDEIDANVGGRMGTIIGEKLRDIAGRHQVLCITHLPQIAAYADRHISIRKAVRDGESYTSVAALTGQARVEELSEMITGKNITPTSLAQAAELLTLAARKATVEKPPATQHKRPAGKSKPATPGRKKHVESSSEIHH
jgi:DNA repair protein RecN (Recombination protein N)